MQYKVSQPVLKKIKLDPLMYVKQVALILTMFWADKEGETFRNAYVKQLHELTLSSGTNCLTKARTQILKKGLLDASDTEGFE